MIDGYLNTLRDSLVKKIEILDSLIEWSVKQKELVSREEVDWEIFDKILDEKSVLIDRLTVLDDGFDTVYNRIQEELNNNKETYKDVIMEIKGLIGNVTERSTSLMALEQRNKVQIESVFARTRRKISHNRMSNEAVSTYYNNMSKLNFIDPQLMDKKK